jgi:glucose/arabinose dehydrogenase
MRLSHLIVLAVAIAGSVQAQQRTAVVLTEAELQLPSQSKLLLRPETKTQAFQVRELLSGLEHPWSMAWLPNGEMLITEREGRLRRVSKDFRLDPRPIEGLPKNIEVDGQGGLFDVAVHPGFIRNGWVYLSFSEGQLGGRLSSSGTALVRAKLDGHRLIEMETLFSMQPKSRGGRHFGGRIVFDRDGFLYLTLGDRGDEDRAQKDNDHAGSVIRLHDDGRIPSSNPFVGNGSVPPEVFGRGNRNIQGAAVHPATGEIWAHEHGPQGGDEINIIRAGRNYGWPTITYGVNYVTGTKIGEGIQKAGMVQPIHIWVPSIAPSGMAFYSGNRYRGWSNSLFVGGLRSQALIRLEHQDNRIVAEERLMVGQHGRIRDVRVGPDGLIYLLTDDNNGKLLRLDPRK